MYSEEVMCSIRQAKGLDEDDTRKDAEIASYSLHKVLDLYLSWHGVIGFTTDIMEIVEARAKMGL